MVLTYFLDKLLFSADILNYSFLTDFKVNVLFQHYIILYISTCHISLPQVGSGSGRKGNCHIATTSDDVLREKSSL